MSLETPSNCWTNNNEKVAEALAASTTFRDLIGAADAAAALARVLGRKLTAAYDGNHYTLDQLQEIKAYGQVFSAPNTPYGKRRRALNTGYEPYGHVIVSLARLVPEADRDEGAGDGSRSDELDREWENLTGDVIDEMLAWLPENGGPEVQDVGVIDVGETPDDREDVQGFWQGCDWLLVWGRAE